jgi:hypothetical protein
VSNLTIHNHPLATQTVPIDTHCVGDRWTIQSSDQLARYVAIIAMGQALHAAKIIHDLEPASPAITHAALLTAAKGQLSIVGTTVDQQDSSRWRRDGFIFECISWLAARQTSSVRTYLKDPHIKSTTQGLDGLMIELDPQQPTLAVATIFEDKCSKNPRAMFRDDVMATFRSHHSQSRGPELVSAAAALIEKSGIDGTSAVTAAARVLDLAFRRYRAALVIEKSDDSEERRKAIFKDYDDLKKLNPTQRIAATFVVDGDLRDSFEELATKAIAMIAQWQAKS